MSEEKNYVLAIGKNVPWNIFSYIATALLGTVSSIVLARYFGISTYGAFGYLTWLTGVLTMFFTLGLDTTIQKFLPPLFFSSIPEERQRASALLKKILLVVLAISSVVILAGILSASFWQPLVHLQVNSKFFLLILGLIISVPTLIANFFTVTFSAIQRFKTVALVTLLNQGLSLALLVMLLVLHQGLVFYIVGLLILAIFTVSAYVIVALRLGLLQGRGGMSYSVSQHRRFFTNIYFNNLLQNVVWARSEIFFLGIFSTIQQIAQYSLAFSLASFATSALSPVSSVIINTLSEVTGKNQEDRMKDIVRRGTKYLSIIVFPMFIGIIFLFPWIIPAFYGKSFSPVAVLLPILLLSQALATSFSIMSSIPTYKEKTRQVLLISIVAGVINIVGDVLLIPHWSALGAAFANLLGQGSAIIMGVTYTNKRLRVSPFSGLLLRVYLLNGLFLVVMAPTLLLHSFLVTAIFLLIVLVMYIFFTLRTSFDHIDVEVIRQIFSTLPKFIRGLWLKLEKLIPTQT